MSFLIVPCQEGLHSPESDDHFVIGISIIELGDAELSRDKAMKERYGGQHISVSLYCEAVANAANAGKSGGAAARGEDIGEMAEPPAEVALEA